VLASDHRELGALPDPDPNPNAYLVTFVRLVDAQDDTEVSAFAVCAPS
jgi:hypothetical protein